MRCMTVRFVDTDVLLCAISRDPDEQVTANRANEILTTRDPVLSVQVLPEFYVRRPQRPRRLCGVRVENPC